MSLVGKVLVVGDAFTGKTSLIRRYVHGWFSDTHKTTVGVDFALKTVSVEGSSQQVSLQLWDIAGQDRFAGLSRIYYKDAVAAVIVFEASSRASLEGTLKWKADIDSKVFLPNEKPIPVLLVGSKVMCPLSFLLILQMDLVESKEKELCVSETELERFAQQNGFIGVLLTSSKTGSNVDAAFRRTAEQVLSFHAMFPPGQRASAGPALMAKGSDFAKLYNTDNNRDKTKAQAKSSCCS